MGLKRRVSRIGLQEAERLLDLLDQAGMPGQSLEAFQFLLGAPGED